MIDTNEWLNGVRIAVIGLGYVGLPLAVEFGKKFTVIGFDIKQDRIAELRQRRDSTLEVEPHEFELAGKLTFTDNVDELHDCNVFIVTVPTPIDQYKRPDLTPLIRASETVGRALKSGDIVIYESTVYPGATEEDCVPVIEHVSGLQYNQDFFCGYSPERINPGDRQHRLPNIRKVTSGSTPAVAEKVDALYASIITAGTFRAESIKVAEAAKVIENTQRDLNIALINELAIIFNQLGIDTQAVLDAAGTKWNFLPFRPGLVGGHCIGVDPYYLTHKAEALGYHPQVILAGRRINDNMASYVADQLVKAMIAKRIQVNGSQVLVLGLSFKENCPDIRNTKVIDVVSALQSFGVEVDVYDPMASAEQVHKEYGLNLIDVPKANTYDGVLLAVAHEDYRAVDLGALKGLTKDVSVIYDLKYALGRELADVRL